MISKYHLYFDKEDYRISRFMFAFPIKGITVYCPDSDKIYRPREVDENKDRHLRVGSLSNCYPPSLSIPKNRMIFFGNSNQVLLHSDAVASIETKVRNKLLTPNEGVRARQALERYKDDKLASLAWPLPEIAPEVDVLAVNRLLSTGGSTTASTGGRFALPLPNLEPAAPPEPLDMAKIAELSARWNKGMEKGSEDSGLITSHSHALTGVPTLPQETSGYVNIASSGEKPIWVRAPNSRIMKNAFN